MIWRRCLHSFRTSSSPASRAPAPMRGIEAHCHLGNLSNYFNFLGIAIGFRLIERRGMGLEDRDALPQSAPSAHVAIAMLQKINGPIEFRSPSRVHNPPLGIVNDHEGSGRYDREH